MSMKMSATEAVAPRRSRWFSDWQHAEHARHFDHRSALSASALVRNYEAFNDVRILREWFPSDVAGGLLEVGCATGEFYRYLQNRYPKLSYLGVDISRAALARAEEKYPGGPFRLGDPGKSLRENLASWSKPLNWRMVNCKDVMHHQVDPWGFLAGLLEVTEEVLILRTRTRSQGATELDPDRSCQYHYGGWMPYLVLNLDELIQRIQTHRPDAQIHVLRHPMVLGGRENRYLPKACYLPETGTAETAVGVRLKGHDPKDVKIQDRKDMVSTSRWSARLRRVTQRLRRAA